MAQEVICLDYGEFVEHKFVNPTIQTISIAKNGISIRTQDLCLDSASSPGHAVVDEIERRLCDRFGTHAVNTQTGNGCCFSITDFGSSPEDRTGRLLEIMNLIADITVPPASGSASLAHHIFEPHEINSARAATPKIPIHRNPFRSW